MSSMSDKVCCQQYVIDYKKVVEEIQETLYKHEKELVNKLQEETTETKKEILEELADVLEVLDAISCSQGSDLTEVTRIKEEKKAKKGGFSKRIYLHKTITK